MHLFQDGYRREGHRSLFGRGEFEAYCALRANHGIALALAIGYEADGIDPQNNAYLRRLAADNDWLRTLAYVEPESAAGPDAIRALMQQGHSGLALYATDVDRARTLLSWPRAAWDVLRERGALVSLKARPEGIAVLEALVRSLPEVRFLFSHLGLPGALPATGDEATLQARLAPLLRLADAGNVFVKLSGLYATSDPAHAYPHAGGARLVKSILEAFGPARCVWGSDFAPALEFVSFAQAVDVPGLDGLTSAERANVFSGNLVSLLGRC
ncbi:amidohydrolase family protein [Dongia sedimenti]|uniref:Amidohydrolase family protein n=1 Tax=Dongia sedimenti TaxID=3064282 RepID=A0ABU0YRN0_9PROT|nr:amidohydrolase family protein [Rhodospirillaceae bacterium R-7]